jgi:hypothetical protein
MRAIILSDSWTLIARRSVPCVKQGFADDRAAMRTVIGRRAAIGVLVLMLSQPVARAMAEDATAGDQAAKPGVEESATGDVGKGRAQHSADSARETDTREAMCLMIESAAKANELPLEFSPASSGRRAAFNPTRWDR